MPGTTLGGLAGLSPFGSGDNDAGLQDTKSLQAQINDLKDRVQALESKAGISSDQSQMTDPKAVDPISVQRFSGR